MLMEEKKLGKIFLYALSLNCMIFKSLQDSKSAHAGLHILYTFKMTLNALTPLD